MSAPGLSPFKDRFSRFFVWTVETPRSFGSIVTSDVFSFQDMQCRFKFSCFEICEMQLMLTEGHWKRPFTLTVLTEKRGTDNNNKPACQILSCDRVEEMPWESRFNWRPVFKSAMISTDKIPHSRYGRRVSRIRFVFIFEEDLTWTDSIELPIQTESAQGSSNNSNFPSNLDNLSLDFANLLKNETLPDVKLKCGGRSNAIPAHRAVLAARSEVFAAMFRNDMAESRSREVDMPDVGNDVIDPFLQYVYSGRIPSGVSDEVVPGLYAAADKYAVHALRETCRERMVKDLTEENCVDFLTVADAHGDAIFKEKVIQFICSHDAVINGDVWLEFAKKPSPLVVEVYQRFVKSKTNVVQTEKKPK